MKKIVFILMFALGSTTIISSKLLAQKFEGKLILGVAGSQIDGDGLGGFYQPGLYAGFAASFAIDSLWSIAPQVTYCRKGSRSSADQQLKGFPFVDFRLDYIELPLMLTFKTTDRSRIQAGPSANVLFRAQYDDGWGLVDISDSFKPIDWAANAAVEYNLLDNLSFNVRFSYSIVEMNKNWLFVFRTPGPVAARSAAFNNSVVVSLKYNLF